MTAKEILEAMLSYTDQTVNSFAGAIGLTRSQALYDIQNEKTKSITPSMADRIIQTFSEINRSWLLTGEGSMLVADEPREYDLETAQKLMSEGVELIPMYSEPFLAGNKGYDIADGQSYIESYWAIPGTDAKQIIQVAGDSMEPTIQRGSYVALRPVYFRVDEPLSLPFGEIYAIATHDPDDPSEYTTNHIKRLYRHPDHDKHLTHWMAHSDNNLYGDFEIRLTHIVGLWRVVADINYRL